MVLNVNYVVEVQLIHTAEIVDRLTGGLELLQSVIAADRNAVLRCFLQSTGRDPHLHLVLLAACSEHQNKRSNQHRREHDP